MNRRTFFRRAAAAAAVALALPFTATNSTSGPIPTFKQHRGQWVVNPEWENAPFEFYFFTGSGAQIVDPWPRRFRSAADGYAWIAEQQQSMRCNRQLCYRGHWQFPSCGGCVIV